MDMKNRSFGLVPQDVAGGMSGLEFLREMFEGRYPDPPFAEVSDLWPVSVEKGRLVFEGRPSSRFYNPMGLVHGGWLALLLDTAMGCAVHSALDAGQAYATTDLRTTFVKPVREATGLLRCEATLLHIGGRTASAEGKILDSRGALIAHGSETCQIFSTAKHSKDS
jgi:uncharacterized protein (TIGR00369 family)